MDRRTFEVSDTALADKLLAKVVRGLWHGSNDDLDRIRVLRRFLALRIFPSPKQQRELANVLDTQQYGTKGRDQWALAESYLLLLDEARPLGPEVNTADDLALELGRLYPDAGADGAPAVYQAILQRVQADHAAAASPAALAEMRAEVERSVVESFTAVRRELDDAIRQRSALQSALDDVRTALGADAAAVRGEDLYEAVRQLRHRAGGRLDALDVLSRVSDALGVTDELDADGVIKLVRQVCDGFRASRDGLAVAQREYNELRTALGADDVTEHAELIELATLQRTARVDLAEALKRIDGQRNELKSWRAALAEARTAGTLTGLKMRELSRLLGFDSAAPAEREAFEALRDPCEPPGNTVVERVRWLIRRATEALAEAEGRAPVWKHYLDLLRAAAGRRVVGVEGERLTPQGEALLGAAATLDAVGVLAVIAELVALSEPAAGVGTSGVILATIDVDPARLVVERYGDTGLRLWLRPKGLCDEAEAEENGNG